MLRQERLPRWLTPCNAGLAVAFAALWAQAAWAGQFWRADFSAFYAGWAIVNDGHAGHVYDLATQEAYQRRLLPEKPADEGTLGFIYPPHDTLVRHPLAWLPRDAAFYVWAALQLGMLGLALYLLRRLVPDWPRERYQLLAVSVLAFPAVFASLQLGQVALVGLLCTLGVLVGLREDRPWFTACWLVVGTVKPQMAVPAAVLLLCLGRWRELARAAALFGVWAGLAALAYGWGSWVAYARLLGEWSRLFGACGVDPLRMYNLKAVLTALLGPGQVMWINAASLAALAGVVVTGVWLCRGGRSVGPTGDLRAAAILWLATLCLPHLNIADLVQLVPPAVLLARHLLRGGPASRAAAGALAVLPWLLALDVYGLPDAPGGVRPFVLLMAAIGAAVLVLLARDRTAGVSPPGRALSPG